MRNCIIAKEPSQTDRKSPLVFMEVFWRSRLYWNRQQRLESCYCYVPILVCFLFIHAEATRLLDHNAPKLHVRLDYVQCFHREVLHVSVQSSRTLSAERISKCPKIDPTDYIMYTLFIRSQSIRNTPVILYTIIKPSGIVSQFRCGCQLRNEKARWIMPRGVWKVTYERGKRRAEQLNALLKGPTVALWQSRVC